MFLQLALLAAEMWLGEVTRPRPHRTTFDEFAKSNQPSEIRPIVYAGGTVELTPSRIWYGDFSQRAVERDSHWTDYIWAGALAFLLDTITVAYRYYCAEMFSLCYGPDTNVERVRIDDRLMYQAAVGSDNAGGGFLIDDPQAWGGDQPPGEGGQYSWCDVTRGNYTDHTNAYLESILTTGPNKTPSLRGISCLISRGRSGFTESGFFAAGGVGYTPRFREWKVTVRRQPDNLATGFNKIGRHMNPMETIYEWATSFDYGARVAVEELNIASFQSCAETLYNESLGWSGKIETTTHPIDVVNNVLAQIDGILDPSPSLGLTARLIRRDYSFGSLRILDRDNVTSVDRFTPGTYEDTINKVIVPFNDLDNNSQPRPGVYIDPANQQIQNGRIVPQTQDYIGVGDYATANLLATRDGRALSIPRAPLSCNVLPSFGRLTYRGEVLFFQWSSPTFTKVMRVLAVTPGTTRDADYSLVMIEDQFATGMRTFGEPGETLHDDPGVGLDTAPPDAVWNDTDFPPDGLIETVQATNTNQFLATITGGITFGTYSPGGQYARIWVTEPGGIQTLSPVYLSPDENNEATFTWPALTVGTYEFCVQTYSLHGVTDGVKVCASIDVVAIGSPSLSPSHSSSLSTSVSPSASTSPSPSTSVSVSASTSPSSSSSPSGGFDPSGVSGLTEWVSADVIVGHVDGDTVGYNSTPDTWDDRLPTSRYWYNLALVNCPRYKTTDSPPNGKPYLRFESGDTLSFSNSASTLLSAGAYTEFMVVRPQRDGTTNGNEFGPNLFNHRGYTGVVLYDASGSNKFRSYIYNGGTYYGVNGSTTFSQNVWYIVETWYDGTDLHIRINGDVEQTVASPNTSSLANEPGLMFSGDTAGQVDLAERITANIELASTDRDDIRTYLADKYGITL